MLALLVLLFGFGIIVGIALLVIGIVMLCKKKRTNGTSTSKTGGILFTVFGSVITLISTIIVSLILLAGAVW